MKGESDLKPIRILQVNNAMISAGIEAFIMNVYRNIDRDQVQFDFLVHYPIPQYYDEEIKRLGGNIHYLTIRKDNNFIKYFKDLDRFFKENEQFHVLHGHMDFYGVFYLFFAWKNGVKIRMIHSHNASITPSIKGVVNYLLDIPLKYMTSYRYACSQKAGKFLFKRKSFKVLNNAIDVQRFIFDENKRICIRKKYNITNEPIYLSVGRFEKQKNHSFMLRIFQAITLIQPQAKLWLIGKGPLEERIKKEIKELDLEDNVLLLGTQTDIQGYLSAADAFLMPSLYEGLPVSGVEALSNGLPCYFSDAITKELDISDGAHFLSLNLSPNDWAQYIIVHFSNHLTNQQQKVIEHGFDIHDQAKKMQELYVALDRKAQGEIHDN